LRLRLQLPRCWITSCRILKISFLSNLRASLLEVIGIRSILLKPLEKIFNSHPPIPKPNQMLSFGVAPFSSSVKSASHNWRFASGISQLANSSTRLINCITNPASECQATGRSRSQYYTIKKLGCASSSGPFRAQRALNVRQLAGHSKGKAVERFTTGETSR
jgi:hypothetical protein